jgi:hypothetical protein
VTCDGRDLHGVQALFKEAACGLMPEIVDLVPLEIRKVVWINLIPRNFGRFLRFEGCCYDSWAYRFALFWNKITVWK